MRKSHLAGVAAMTAMIVSAVLPATANGAVRAGPSGDAIVTSVSCSTAGNCVAGGHGVGGSLNDQPFVLIEKNGRWGRATEVPGLAAIKHKLADIGSVSCAPAGGCAAGGYYKNASGYHAFVTSERSGRWSRLTTVFTPKTKSPIITEAGSLSCTAPGQCTAGGGPSPFVVSQVNGRWGRAIQFPVKDPNGAAVVSCASAGNCLAAVGTSVVSERRGHWGKPRSVPGLSAFGTGAEISSVSCTSAVNCAVGGLYSLRSGDTEVFVASEQGGRWGKAMELPGFTALNQAGTGELAGVRCISAGNCVAAGDYAAPAGFQGGVFEAFVADERNGRWGKAFEIPGIPSPGSSICEPDSTACVTGMVLSVSCAADGRCAAGGDYDTTKINGQVAFVANYKNGRWSKVMQIRGLESVTDSQVSSVSCTRSGGCAAGGIEPQLGPAFVVDGKNGVWGQAQPVRF